MSKSIAKKTLAIAKKREAEQFKSVKEKFLAIIQQDFEDRVRACEPWKAVGDKYYYFATTTFKDFNVEELEMVCKDIGFMLRNYECCGQYGLSIPEWIKGKKRTQAQLMLYWSNIEIKRNIKSRKESARRVCKEALEKLENGDFVASKCKDTYDLTVKMSYSEDNNQFKDEVQRIFERKKIELLGIDVTAGEWSFRIKEK